MESIMLINTILITSDRKQIYLNMSQIFNAIKFYLS